MFLRNALSKVSLVCLMASVLCVVSSGIVFSQDTASEAPAVEEVASPGAAVVNETPEGSSPETEAAAEAPAEEAPQYALQSDANLLWTCIAAFLVFFMQAGFALVECGFTRAKNAVNIIMKNLLDFCIGSVVYLFIGFGLMFGVTYAGLIGTDGFGLAGYMLTEDGSLNHWTFAFWIFQVVFAATSATIVSGAMAERTKFQAYLVYTTFISAIIYPIFGSWAWGNLFLGADNGGWLVNMGFVDFAGSTVVHSIGGWAALAGAICLGPRLGKYSSDGLPQVIHGHNIPMAALGVFILWLGWFGFNPGSTTSLTGNLAVIAVTTNMAGAAGTISALIVSWLKFGKSDIGMTLNGTLAGLVAITAGCANVSPVSAVIIGAIAGVVVVYAIIALENIGIDDPVGAVSVHGVCGALGTLLTGIFAEKSFGGLSGLIDGGGFALLQTQAIGVVAAFIWSFSLSFLLFTVIKATMGLRVSAEEEMEGLDLGEHAASAYADFATNSVR